MLKCACGGIPETTDQWYANMIRLHGNKSYILRPRGHAVMCSDACGAGTPEFSNPECAEEAWDRMQQVV